MTDLWILQHYATPPDTVSGSRHFNIARILTKYGYNVTIFASSFNHSSLRQERLKYEDDYCVEVIDNVKFFWIKTPSYTKNDWKRLTNIIYYTVKVYYYGLRAKEKPEIIWASNPHLFSGLSGYFLSKKYGSKFIFEVRDLWPQVFLDIGAFSSNHPMILCMKYIEKFLYKRAMRIITLMPNAKVYIKACGVDYKKIEYLPHGVDLEVFSKFKIYENEDLIQFCNKKKSQGKILIGYLGSHGIADALETVVQCCKILQDYKEMRLFFIMVGHGSEKKRLVKKTLEIGLNNIIFYDSIPKYMVPSVINLFDITIVHKKKTNLYRYGTSFIKTFDYMAAGKPILWAVDSPDNPVMAAECGITIRAEDPTGMAAALIQLSEMDQTKLKHIGLKGNEYVRKFHENNVIGLKMKEIIENL